MKLRRRAYFIGAESFMHILMSGKVIEIIDGIPPDAQFRGFTIDPRTNSLCIFVDHESFKEINEWEIATEHIITARILSGKLVETIKRLSNDQENSDIRIIG